MEQVIFKVDQKVFDIKYGWGIVVAINDSIYPVVVAFRGREIGYTTFGEEYESVNRSLYHHDYTPKEDVASNELNVYDTSKSDRLKLAGMAMQGLLVNHYPQERAESIASTAVAIADATIKALNEKQS